MIILAIVGLVYLGICMLNYMNGDYELDAIQRSSAEAVFLLVIVMLITITVCSINK